MNWNRASGLHSIGFDCPSQVIDQPALQNHRSLGVARRSRSVHYIRQIRGSRQQFGIALTLACDRWPIRIKEQRPFMGR